MRLSKAKAIKICKEIWNEIGKKPKFDAFPEKYTKEFEYDCPLCEWVYQGGRAKIGEGQLVDDRIWCFSRYRHICPLIRQYGQSCRQLGFDGNGSSPRFLNAVKGLVSK